MEQLLLQSCVDESLEILVSLVDDKKVFGTLRNEVIALKERYVRLTRLKRQEIINEEKIWNRQNKLVDQILAIKDELSERVG